MFRHSFVALHYVCVSSHLYVLQSPFPIRSFRLLTPRNLVFSCFDLFVVLLSRSCSLRRRLGIEAEAQIQFGCFLVVSRSCDLFMPAVEAADGTLRWLLVVSHGHFVVSSSDRWSSPAVYGSPSAEVAGATAAISFLLSIYHTNLVIVLILCSLEICSTSDS